MLASSARETRGGAGCRARGGPLHVGLGASSPLAARSGAAVGAWCRGMAGKGDEGDEGGHCEESGGRGPDRAAPHAAAPGDRLLAAASLRRISHRLTPFSFQVPAGYDYSKATNENYGLDARAQRTPSDCGPFMSIRETLDHDWHGHYTPERQQLQDLLIADVIGGGSPNRSQTPSPSPADSPHALRSLALAIGAHANKGPTTPFCAHTIVRVVVKRATIQRTTSSLVPA